ncbi:hypothetical protein ABZW18_33720 [Streptomyces sp. NPDC004647]|uniref:hypothetical protein n=1 Tax=Streptomyces sp. NPDC004647 TaxID=3154671 RepID=UPI0033A1BF2C
MKEKDNAASTEGTESSVTHATPLKRDATYDHRAQQAALGIELHHTDGRTTQAVLHLTPDQVELYAIQFEQLIDKRQRALEAGQP